MVNSVCASCKEPSIFIVSGSGNELQQPDTVVKHYWVQLLERDLLG